MAGNHEVINAWKARNKDKVRIHNATYYEKKRQKRLTFQAKHPKLCKRCTKCQVKSPTASYCDDCSVITYYEMLERKWDKQSEKRRQRKIMEKQNVNAHPHVNSRR